MRLRNLEKRTGADDKDVVRCILEAGPNGTAMENGQTLSAAEVEERARGGVVLLIEEEIVAPPAL